MPRKITHTYKVAGSCAIQADLYYIPGDSRPGLVWIHGGALIGGNRGNIKPDQLDFYLEQGYNLISIDYRLAPETKLPSIIHDITDAYEWILGASRAMDIDDDRLAIIGHSAGGYLALMGGFRLGPPPRAIVSFYGYGDITAPWYKDPDPYYCNLPAVSRERAYSAVGKEIISHTDDPGRWDFYLYLRQKGLWPELVTGFDPAKNPEVFLPFCPIRNVTPDFPPTMLIHGKKDTDVPYSQSADMSRELEHHGVDHDLLLLPEAGHGFDGQGLDNDEVCRVFGKVNRFLSTHV